MQPETNISDEELQTLLDAIDPYHRGDGTQRVRLVKLIAAKSGATTSEVRSEALVGNISDVANQVNELATHTEFFVGAIAGDRVKDRFGSYHQLHHWHLFRKYTSEPNTRPLAGGAN